MAIYRFQFSLPYFTALPSDVIVNDWALSWSLPGPSESNFDDVRDRLITFYTTIYELGAGDDQLAPWIDPTAASVKAYNINDPIPRAPVYESLAAIPVTPAASSAVPLEAAICLSFQGNPISGVPQARRRGRVFLGGWAHPIAAGDSDSFPIVDPIITAGIADAANTFATGTISDGWVWVVYSRVLGTGAPISNGWVDNALDTQRRRGTDATARTVFP